MKHYVDAYGDLPPVELYEQECQIGEDGACEVCGERETRTATRPPLVLIIDGKLTCPGCGSNDIREHDRAERWNTIHYRADGSLSIAQGDAEFETVGLACADCESALTEPDGFFDRAEWY